MVAVLVAAALAVAAVAAAAAILAAGGGGGAVEKPALAIGSAYVYEAGDGSEIRTELIGEGTCLVYQVDLGGGSEMVFIEAGDGSLRFGESAGAGSWRIGTRAGTLEASIEKIDGRYNIAEMEIVGGPHGAYALNPEKGVSKSVPAAASSCVGEKLIYKIEAEAEASFADTTLQGKKFNASGTAEVTCVADAADGRHIYVTETEVAWLSLGSASEWMKIQIARDHSGGHAFIVSESMDYRAALGKPSLDALPQAKDKVQGQTIDGTVTQNIFAFSDKHGTIYELKIGEKSGRLYNATESVSTENGGDALKVKATYSCVEYRPAA
ncbi:MAG: hypothetical protein LBG62_03390 [Candidatus Methanoplasma sp.]|nr:hypothetical protein [Candidatus Methanoplasma sp.]